MFFHMFGKKSPAPHFGLGFFLLIIAIFGLVSQFRPVVGLTGLGTVLILAGILVEINHKLIWEHYIKSFKKRKGEPFWNRPSKVYYDINVFILWPFVIFFGLLCLWAAYIMSRTFL